MKILIQITTPILLAILLVFSVSSSIIGINKTASSIKVTFRELFNTNHRNKIIRSNYADSITTNNISNVLGTSHSKYSNLILEDVKTIEPKLIPAPLLVPSSGIAGHKDFLYIPGSHEGIDIWTSNNGWGKDGDRFKGNPVYAACSGIVVRVYKPNEEIEIVCDPIDIAYKDIVPSLQVKILYSHMGHPLTHEAFHKFYIGKRVTRGEYVGNQGNVSSFAPQNRIVHLHFGVYDMSVGGIPPALNPDAYIGVPTNIVGQFFVANPEDK